MVHNRYIRVPDWGPVLRTHGLDSRYAYSCIYIYGAAQKFLTSPLLSCKDASKAEYLVLESKPWALGMSILRTYDWYSLLKTGLSGSGVSHASQRNGR